MTDSLGTRRRLVYNAAAGGIANFAKVTTQLFMLPVLARIIGPQEFGLYALALPTINFFSFLADGGLGISLAREDESSEIVWSTAFWAVLAVCTIISVGVSLGGIVLARASHEPRLADLMAFLSTTFVMIALTTIPAARLVRRGNLVYHSIADLTSTLIGAALAVVLASEGAGAWALAAQYVSGFAIRTVVMNIPAFAFPRFIFRLSSLWPHLATGSSLIGSRLTDFGGRVVENLLYGRFFGAAALGGYTFANQSSRFLCEAVSAPLWSALYSHAVFEGTKAIDTIHAKLARLLALFVFPAVALVAGGGPQIIDLILGPKWASAAPLLQIIAVFYALNTVATQNTALLLADGRNAIVFWTSATLTAARVAAVAGGPWIGPVGVAWGIAAANLLFVVIMFSVMVKVWGGKVSRILQGLFTPALSSILAGVGCHLLMRAHADSPAWTLLSLSMAGVAYLVCMFALEGKVLLMDIMAVWRIFKK